MPEKIFLRLLSAALNGEKPVTDTKLSKEGWSKVFLLAEKHRLLPLMYDCLYENYPFDKSDLLSIKSRVKLLVSQQTLRTQTFLDLYRNLQEKELSPVVVKGIVCRTLYRCPDLRYSSDEDLLITYEEADRYSKVFSSLSLTVKNENDKEKYQTSFFANDGLHIELHKSLFPPKNEYFAPWNKIFEDAYTETTSITAEGINITTLSPTLNLLYLTLHTLKHFLHSGVGIRQICDIILFANKYGKDIDWQRFFTLCQNINAKDFSLAIFAIGEKHLNFRKNAACFPENISLSAINEAPLLDDILSSGVFGSATMSRKHSAGITFSAVQGKKPTLFGRVFPAAKSLGNRYSYAKKIPLLLPVAWIHRLVNYRKETRSTTDNSPSQSLEIGKNRIELLKLYGLIQNK